MILSSGLFDYVPGEDVLVSEISTLEANAPGRVFDVLYDEVWGITVRSERTGNAVDFGVTDVDRDADGDIRAWRLRPMASPWDGRLVIFND